MPGDETEKGGDTRSALTGWRAPICSARVRRHAVIWKWRRIRQACTKNRPGPNGWGRGLGRLRNLPVWSAVSGIV